MKRYNKNNNKMKLHKKLIKIIKKINNNKILFKINNKMKIKIRIILI